MTRYYVNRNAQPTGEHEVHKYGCSWLPKEENRIYLGRFYTCQAAVLKACEYYTSVDGCAHCSPDCHTR